MFNAATSGTLLDLTFAISRDEGTGFAAWLYARLGEETWRRGPYRLYLDETRFPTALPPDDYGDRLGEALFEDHRLLLEFEHARTLAREHNTLVRWRILFDTSLNDAEQLHAMRWETIRHPITGSPLLLCDDLIFSRFVTLRKPFTPNPPPRSWRALAAAPSPTDSADWGLPRLDPPREFEPLARAWRAGSLEPRPFPHLPGEFCTVEGLLDGLRGRDYGHAFETLFLACQGDAAHFDQPVIFFERPDGRLRVVRCEAFNDWLGGLDHGCPCLVVLFAGERSTPETPPALVRLSQLLPYAGIPAGVGMQGCLAQPTANRFFEIFFSSLTRREPVDCAVHDARLAIRAAPDWWMPALFLSLEDGQLADWDGRAASQWVWWVR